MTKLDDIIKKSDAEISQALNRAAEIWSLVYNEGMSADEESVVNTANAGGERIGRVLSSIHKIRGHHKRLAYAKALLSDAEDYAVSIGLSL